MDCQFCGQQQQQQEVEDQQPLQGQHHQQDAQEEHHQQQQQQQVDLQQRSQDQHQSDAQHAETQQYEDLQLQSQLPLHLQAPPQFVEEQGEEEEDAQQQQQHERVPPPVEDQAAKHRILLRKYREVQGRVRHAEKVNTGARQHVQDLVGQIGSQQKTLKDLQVLVRRSQRILLHLRARKTQSEEFQVECSDMLVDLKRQESEMSTENPFLQFVGAMDGDMDIAMMLL